MRVDRGGFRERILSVTLLNSPAPPFHLNSSSAQIKRSGASQLGSKELWLLPASANSGFSPLTALSRSPARQPWANKEKWAVWPFISRCHGGKINTAGTQGEPFFNKAEGFQRGEVLWPAGAEGPRPPSDTDCWRYLRPVSGRLFLLLMFASLQSACQSTDTLGELKASPRNRHSKTKSAHGDTASFNYRLWQKQLKLCTLHFPQQ